MNNNLYQLIIDLHCHNERQGPGGKEESLLAAKLAGLQAGQPYRIADIGSGTGVTSLLLAEQFDATITAVDTAELFLEQVRQKAKEQGSSDRISTLNASMDALPFEDASLDVIWSEGAVYNIGFERGVYEWQRFLKPGGVLVVSEITWLQRELPEELRSYWEQEYPEVDTAAAKLAILEAAGYTLLGYFPLPSYCWIQNYLEPLVASAAAFLDRHQDNEDAATIVKEQMSEKELYEKYHEYFGYGMYIAKKL